MDSISRDMHVPIIRRNDKRMVQRFSLKSQHFGKTNAGQELHVEDFLDRGLEPERADDPARAEVDGGDAAFELFTPFRERDTIHCGRGADFR